MNSVDYGEVKAEIMHGAIDLCNRMFRILENINCSVHDEQDFEYIVDNVYYSPAHDEVIINFKEAKK